MLRRTLTFILNILWKTVAVLIVSAAVLVSVARALLPHIDRYSGEIRTWLSREVNQPVAFDQISADWRGWTPVIEVSNLRLKDRQDGHVLTSFQSARISIDLVRSFARHQLSPGALTVSGAHISLARDADGSIRVEGTAPNDLQATGLQQNALAYWLQRQRKLTIESAAITWRDQRSLFKPLVFSRVTLSLRSDGDRHQLEGTAQLPDAAHSRFRFVLDAKGDLLTPLWSGQLYLEGEGIKPSTLLQYSGWLGLEIVGGTLDFKVWTDWRNARLMDVSGHVAADGVDVGTHTRRIHLERAHGNIAARRDTPQSWYLSADHLIIVTPNGSWPDTSIDLALDKPDDQTEHSLVANISFVRLQDVAPVLREIPSIPDNLRDTLARTRPSGELRDLRFGYFPGKTAGQRFFVQTRVDQLSIESDSRIAGVNDLSGRLNADASTGTLALDSPDLQVTLPGNPHMPVNVKAVQGNVTWQRQDAGWRINTQDLRLTAAGLPVTASGTVDWQAGHSPQLNLRARLGQADIAGVMQTLPQEWLRPKLHEWMQQGLHHGRIVSGAVLLRGPLDRFPYDQHEGAFEAQFDVAGADLQFSPHWPLMDDIDATVRFEGRKLFVDATTAQTLGARLTGVHAVIQDLSAVDHIVEVDGQAEADVDAARQYAANSPLNHTLAPVLQYFSAKGKAALKLKLIVPLHPDAETRYQGRLSVTGAAISIAPLKFALNGIQGNLDFSPQGFTATGLLANYVEHPVTINLQGSVQPGRIDSTLEMSGHTDAGFLDDRLHTLTPAVAQWLDGWHLRQRMSGQTDWQVNLNLRRDQSGVKPLQVAVKSSLQGLALDLPHPLGKTAGEDRSLDIVAHLDDPAGQDIDFHYGNTVTGRLVLAGGDNKATSMQQALIHLGPGPNGPDHAAGVQVDGAVDKLSVTEWGNFLKKNIDVAPATASTAPGLPVAIDVAAGRIETLGRWFDNIKLKGQSTANDWKFHIAGDQIEGEVDVPYAFQSTPTVVNLKHLHVPPRTVDKDRKIDLDPRRVPPVKAHCDQLVFENIDFGRVDLTTHPTAEGLQLDSLDFKSPAAKIDASGDWRFLDSVHTSQFKIRVEAPKLAALLGQFGYEVNSIEGGRTAVDIRASWGGTPADFTLEKLDGTMNMSVKDGRFLDIDPAAGRLFGLLSMQALPRRLLLDFNDLFKKGTEFDKITGTFELDGGNAYTNDLTMDSPSVLIEITGRTGLAKRDYDQIATVTPQLSDSFPVASAVFGPAGIGVGAAIYLGKKLFKSIPDQIDRILSKQYTITGSWEKPVIEPVKPASSGQG